MRFWVDGIKRTDIFNECLYLICSIAATKVHMIGSGDLRVPNQATTFALSEYSTIMCLEYLPTKSCMATKAANSSSRATGTCG